MGISLFCRLSEAHPQAISALQSQVSLISELPHFPSYSDTLGIGKLLKVLYMQYRMCQGIMELSNALIYGDRLRCGSSEIANGKLNFSRLKSCSSWLNEVSRSFEILS